ncbi:putative histidine kinase group protein [Sordaria brevicollis]|uniref:Histidine kinase group protein n=1 Tax=Sordaria brevicollis TaxID=83679 RepID=A0AAE0PE86_SORBR|nr:putative histidine kinase group protein [Sordaria brevicollis]
MHPSFLTSGIIDLLEADQRPSFIVALTPHPPTIVYTNPALDADARLQNAITTRKGNNVQLWEWLTDLSGACPSGTGQAAANFSFMNIYWTRTIVRPDMVVVGANDQPPSSEPPRKIRVDEAPHVESVVPAPVRLIPVKDDAPELESTQTGVAPVAAVAATPAVPSLTSSLSLAPPDYISLSRTRSGPATLPLGSVEYPLASPEMIQSLKRSTTDPGWILPDIMPETRSFLEVIHSVDWDATPLGPMKDWPPTLEQTFHQILADSRPIAIYWGTNYVTLYNEAFSKLCGSKHPALLGMTVENAWQEAGEKLKDAMSRIARKESPTVEDEWRFFIEREPEVEGGPPWQEETYLKWSLVPILDKERCVGFIHPVGDITSVRLWERRMKMLVDLGEDLVVARDVKSYWDKTLQDLKDVEPCYDIPLAVLYSVDEFDGRSGIEPGTDGPAKVCRLAGALGVPEVHPLREEINLSTDEHALAPALREAVTARQPLLLQIKDGTLPQEYLRGLQTRGFMDDPCRAVVIMPIRVRIKVMGLLLLGLNPRRPYDNDYRQYILLLSQKLTTSLASVVLLEEEARRGRNAAEQAAYDQARLKEKLAVQTKEANESIKMFEALAEFVPVGMCFGDPQGNITFANDAWYKMTGFPGNGPIANNGFLACVKEEDRQNIVTAYEKLKTERYVEYEFRVKRQTNTDVAPSLTRNSPSFEKAGLDLVPIDQSKERHIFATAKAERAPDGTIIRTMTCLTDVTAHKHAAEEAVRRAQQAENLKRMAEFATVGMYDMDLEGRLLGANDVFYEMCGLQKVDPTEVTIRPLETCVWAEDVGLVMKKLKKMVIEDKVQNVEVRLRTTWTADDGAGHKVVMPRWVQATLMPVRSTEGVIQSFTGCLSDVSLQKWQLDREKQRKEEAIESKRQQENFIDMTSHEMRNPLSAIIHCADAITATLSRVQELVGGDHHGSDSDARSYASEGAADSQPNYELRAEVCELLDNGIDSAETIVGCAQHQKRIVDDILTMSKLDSKLLAITPITVNPIQMVKEALKMFEVEARRVDINLSMVVDKSYYDLGVKYLDFDPSRLKQVLINLLTNALKFTKTGPTRNVTVGLSASLTRPTEATSSVQFIPRSQERYGDSDAASAQDRGDPTFLTFEVKDTGQGLTEEEKKSLFQRFVQASSRTHVKYGGSGLGLFISRRLTELQNGAIGVASQPGVGSTFAFYIEAYQPSESSIRDAEATAVAAKAAMSDLMAKAPNLRSMRPSHPHRGSTSSPRPSPVASSPIVELGGLTIPPPQIRGIMVVEDNLINQQITRRGLTSMGFTVDVANHGLECLEKLQRTDRYVSDDVPINGGPNNKSATMLALNGTVNSPVPPVNGGFLNQSQAPSVTATTMPAARFPLSVILMDIEMPVQDGLTCTRQIRELERQGKITGGRLPIIAVSANARIEQILEAKEAGCDDVLIKPYRMPELLEKMRIVMGTVANAGTSSAGAGAGPAGLGSTSSAAASGSGSPAGFAGLDKPRKQEKATQTQPQLQTEGKNAQQKQGSGSEAGESPEKQVAVGGKSQMQAQAQAQLPDGKPAVENPQQPQSQSQPPCSKAEPKQTAQTKVEPVPMQLSP